MEKALSNKKSALLVIDVQDSFKADSDRWDKRSNHQFEANVQQLIDAYRQTNQHIIFVLHSDDDDAFQRSSPYYKLMDFIEPAGAEPILHKTTRSCFASTNLKQHLDSLGINHLVITGIQTEQCCETTTRDAKDLGYTVDYVTEATLTFPIQHWQSGTELSTDAIIERTEYVLAKRFADIKTVNEIIQALPQSVNA